MAMSDQTIQVSDLSPKVTLMDLKTFFSYCGTVTDIQLERKVDQSQSALVTFTQPYALKTALLLNDAVIADSRIRIWPLKNTTSHFNSNNMNYNNQLGQNTKTLSDSHLNTVEFYFKASETWGNKKNVEKRGGVAPTAHQSVVEAMASKGYKILNRVKEEVEGKYKISEKVGRALVKQTNGMAISAAEESDCFSAGALWVSGVLDKVAKYTSKLGHQEKRRITNSRK